MSTIAPQFRLSRFVGSLFDIIFWILLLFSLIGLPIVFIILFYIKMPIVNHQLLTPYLAMTWMADPSRTLPIIKTLLHTTFFHVVAFPGFGFAALLAAATIFIERKFLAKIQLRVGPLYCGKIEGILQLMGDGLKLISKEIIIPAKADKPIFWVGPLLFLGTAAALVSLVPVAPGGWVVANPSVGLLAVFATIGFFPIITVLTAWAANNKWTFIGGLRALHQMIAFEIPLILSLLSIVILTGTLNLSQIVESQQHYWWIIFAPISAIVFFICIIAELERVPFDLPEAESEIVAGWLTEFSGMMYGLIQLGTYLKLYAFAGLFTVLFLGGWNGPSVWPPLSPDLITNGITIGPITAKIAGLPLFDQAMLNGTLWFVIKTVGVILVILLPRGVFPRIRIDMLLHTGWYKLIGLAFINIFIALGLLYAGVLGPGGLIQ
ncbi:MAG: NADH-quinone oxidoreductase subunit NuoH [Nitrosotalea sp.]